MTDSRSIKIAYFFVPLPEALVVPDRCTLTITRDIQSKL